jgi:hypothetical protein
VSCEEYVAEDKESLNLQARALGRVSVVETMMAKLWDRPTSLAVGDADLTPIFTAVGESLTEWEELQVALVHLHCAVVNDHRWETMRALGVLDSVIPRVMMIDAAAEAVFGKGSDLFRRVKAVTDEVAQFNQRRNDIAHGTAMEFATETLRGNFLVPSIMATKKTTFGKGTLEIESYFNYRFTSDQIRAYKAQFTRLRIDAGIVSTAIQQHYRNAARPAQ